MWSPFPMGAINISGIAEPKAEIRNKTAAKMSPFFRPNFFTDNATKHTANNTTNQSTGNNKTFKGTCSRFTEAFWNHKKGI